MPLVTSTDLDMMFTVYSMDFVGKEQQWAEHELGSVRREFNQLLANPHSTSEQYDTVCMLLFGLHEVYSAFLQRAVDQVHAARAALQDRPDLRRGGPSLEQRLENVVSDFRAARMAISRDLAAATVARWLKHEHLYNRSLQRRDRGAHPVAQQGPLPRRKTPAEAYRVRRNEQWRRNERVLSALRGTGLLAPTRERNLLIDCFIERYVTPEAAHALGTYPPPSFARFVDVYREEAADTSSATVVLYYALLDYGDPRKLASLRAQLPLTPRMEQWTTAIWQIDHGLVRSGLAALHRAGLLYDRIVIDLVRAVYVRAPELNLHSVFTALGESPAALPRTAVDALVRLHMLVRAAALDEAYEYYRSTFASLDSSVAADMSAYPNLPQQVLESVFQVALESGHLRLLVALQLEKGDANLLEQYLQRKGLYGPLAAYQISHGVTESLAHVLPASCTDSLIVNAVHNVQVPGHHDSNGDSDDDIERDASNSDQESYDDDGEDEDEDEDDESEDEDQEGEKKKRKKGKKRSRVVWDPTSLKRAISPMAPAAAAAATPEKLDASAISGIYNEAGTRGWATTLASSSPRRASNKLGRFMTRP